jgi:hypothetical protein
MEPSGLLGAIASGVPRLLLGAYWWLVRLVVK